MNGYWALGLLIFGIGLGIFVEDKFKIAGQVEALYAQIAATEKAQEQTSTMIGAYNANVGALAATVNSNKESLNADAIKDPIRCPVPVKRLQLLRATAEAARRAGGGTDY